MKLYHEDDLVTLWHGDCLDVLRELPDASVDAVVTDPPYGLEFMGKAWDSFGTDTSHGYREKPRITDREVREGTLSAYTGAGGKGVNHFQAGPPFQRWCELWTAECLRVLKPGGHMLAFGGTRTWHRLACAVEDAGFEVRDSIAWMYGSGFPKSMNVGKAITAHQQTGSSSPQGRRKARMGDDYEPGVAAAQADALGAKFNGFSAVEDHALTVDGERWQGWGTALKPAFEPIVVARKPLVGTVAANVLAHGTGALNIDGCRVEHGDDLSRYDRSATSGFKRGGIYGDGEAILTPASAAGRWPANVILDESQAAELDEQSGELTSGANPTRRGSDKFRDAYGDFAGQESCEPARGADSGGASRFFYVAKADQAERVKVDGVAHPTVKPLELMRWLVRLVTPPGGTVLEPFAGSGTTVEACLLEGFQCIAIEREADYLPLIVQRINRRRDPVAAVLASAEDGGLFDLLEEGA